jgi:hypothetical protein
MEPMHGRLSMGLVPRDGSDTRKHSVPEAVAQPAV